MTLQSALRANASGLLAYFERRTSCAADAADLLAEVMEVAWRRQNALPDDPQQQRMWLFGIAGKVLGHHWRARGDAPPW